MTDIFLRAGATNPADIVLRDLTALGLSYTLTAVAGAIAIAGTDANFAIGMPAASGSIEIAGVDITFRVGMPAAAGSIAITGTDATFRVGMPAAAGAVPITGTAAAFIRGYVLQALAGAIAITSTDAQLVGLGQTPGVDVFVPMSSGWGGSLLDQPRLQPRRYVMACEPGAVPIDGYAAQFHVKGTEFDDDLIIALLLAA